jgi:spore coat polysaccharide biosynthesis protein SpsF (cytidylyltransferase family)
MTSSRLPGKPLREISGKSALARVAGEAARCSYVERVVIATTDQPSDDVLAEHARSLGYPVHRGPAEDILRRLDEAARAFGLEIVVEVDGDDLLCSCGHMDRAVEILQQRDADLVTFSGLPLGATPTVLRSTALARAVEERTGRPNSTGFFRFLLESGRFRVVREASSDPRDAHPTARLTLDYPQDLAFFDAVYRELDALGTEWTLATVVALLHRRPDLLALNHGLEAIYAEHFRQGLAE